MACACTKGGRVNSTFIWTDPDNPEITVSYPSEIQAKAKQIRNGGSYVRVDG